MSVINPIAEEFVGRQIHTADTHTGGEVIRRKVDAVIVGTGPGGLVTGTVLAEAGLDVLLVEAGRFWPLGKFKRQQSWASKNLFQENGTRLMTGNAFIPLASGRGVGGGTLVNSAICFRAPDAVLDEWTDRWGLDFWARDKRDALYKEVERTIGVAPTAPAVAGQNSFVAKRGFERLGLSSGFMPRNAPNCVGCGTCQTGCPTGGKATGDLTWLPRILRKGGVVYADTRVEEIVVEKGRAVGVRGVMRDPEGHKALARVEVQADKVIIACGAINTAMLLQHQGLANGSGMVGKNLHVHPSCAVVARFDEPIRIWSGATQGYYAHHPENPEILLETFSAPPEVFLSQVATVGAMDMSEFLRDLHNVAGCGALIKDESSGVVRRGDDGRAKIKYEVSRQDRLKLTEGLRTLVEMYFAAGARSVMPMIARSRFFTSRNEAYEHVQKTDDPADMSLYASHPMGTCRIGEDRNSCVVRPQDGQTHDVEGLYITDSSLFPSALGANPQMTIMAQSLALARRMIRA